MDHPDLTLFRDILRIRMIEEEIARVYPEQEMRCPIHLSVGQEATPVGVFAHLKWADHVVSTHRAHAHYLAKKGSLKALLCELYGKLGGCAKGQGGSMHLIDLSQNFIGATSIVGGTIPIGVGSAFTAKLRKEDRISVVCIGDTAVEEGVFHESMNFAALKKLPVLFLCENNGYSCYSPLTNRQPDRPLSDLAAAHAVRSLSIGGNDVHEVYRQTIPVFEHLRSGQGPFFLETKTFRFLEHCGPFGDDNLGYRKQAEIDWGRANDPLENGRKHLTSKGLYSAGWEDGIRTSIAAEISEAFLFAKASPFPPREELGAYLYAK